MPSDMSKHAIKRLYVPICPLMTTFVNLKELQMTLIKSKLQTALIDIIRWFSRQVTVTWQLMKRATLMNRRGPFQSFMHNLSTCYLTCSIITSSPQQICQPCVLQFGSHGSWHFLRTLSCRPDRWRGSLSILRNKEKFCQRPWHQHSAFLGNRRTGQFWMPTRRFWFFTNKPPTPAIYLQSKLQITKSEARLLSTGQIEFLTVFGTRTETKRWNQ